MNPAPIDPPSRRRRVFRGETRGDREDRRRDEYEQRMADRTREAEKELPCDSCDVAHVAATRL